MSKRKAASDHNGFRGNFGDGSSSKKKKLTGAVTPIRPQIHTSSPGNFLLSKFTTTRRAGASSTSRLKPTPAVAPSLPQLLPTQTTTLTPLDTPATQRTEKNYAGQVDRPIKLEDSTSDSDANIGFEARNNVLSNETVDPELEHGQATNDSSHYGLALARQGNDLEKALDGLQTAMEKFIAQNEEHYQRTHMKLDRLLEILTRHGIVQPTAPARAQASSSNTAGTGAASGSDSEVVFLNPAPTPGLVALVSKVVAGHPSRVGAKKVGVLIGESAEDTKKFKGHARTTFYRMLVISSWREIPPFFVDEHGNSDVFPFKDPKTGYRQPFPNWELPLTKQVAWIPTFLFRFKATIPNDGSQQSAKLRDLSDERILQLMHDGPFRTGRGHWRALGKTDEQLKGMRLAVQRERAAAAVEATDENNGDDDGKDAREGEGQGQAGLVPQSVAVEYSSIPEFGSNRKIYLPLPNRIVNSMPPLSHIPAPVPADEFSIALKQKRNRESTRSNSTTGSGAGSSAYLQDPYDQGGPSNLATTSG